jgi:glycosyltransferase involved in cell wall biosynthesis
MKVGIIGIKSGVHESRFMRAFRERGAETVFIGFDELAQASGNWRLVNRFTELDFVFGGPLHLGHKIAPSLKTIPFIAVSYAFDLLRETVMRPDAASSVTSMLDASRGLLVDCEAVAEAARKNHGYSKPILIRAWGLENVAIDAVSPGISTKLEHGATPPGATVVSVRNFTDVHGIMDVIHGFSEAASSNPTLRLVMAGDGPLRPQIVAAIKDLGLTERVNLLGRIPESEMIALIRKADLYVSASLVDGTSISLLQALESGVPVLLSKVGGNVEWAKRVGGADLFEAGNWRQLGTLIGTRISTRRFDRSSVLRRFADWQSNADDMVRFCLDVSD